MATPQLLSRKANGVLPVAASQASGESSQKPVKTKAAPEGDKVVIRRLPPGMTADEFVKILGDEWEVGGGKVDWLSYKSGKISHKRVHPPRSKTPMSRLTPSSPARPSHRGLPGPTCTS